MYKYSKNMTLEEYQNNFLKDEKYVDFCKRLYAKLGNAEYKANNGVQKNTMCFIMALLLNGISSANDSCGQKFIQRVAFFSKASPWTRQAGAFYKVGKNAELDVTASELEKIKKYSTNKTLQDIVNWFFDESGIEIQKQKKDADGNSISAKEDLRLAANNMLSILVLQNSFDNITYVEGGNMVELLKNNKQLILNGAPGTGKTYSAKNEIANGLFGFSEPLTEEQKKEKEFRMAMVQFHPSYDYTDFIEGIRPNLESNAISYTLKNGVFKDFCSKAGVLERIDAVGKERNRNTIAEFLHLVNEGESAPEEGVNEILDFWDRHKEEKELPPFLFIIDEINRAEISKVLGEVMYSLDPDYRGETGKIKTQYSNSTTKDSFYISREEDAFFIPSNVYIIGTMNDIDRSVEVFDFALRRRFAWHEVKAEEVMLDVLEAMGVDAKLGDKFASYMEKVSYINKAIEEELNLTRQYHLGPSYFAKIVQYYEKGYAEALRSVWENHIAQILTEYAKNKKNLENKIAELGNGFCEMGNPA